MSKATKQIICMVFFMLVSVSVISVSALENSPSLSDAGGTNTTYSISSEADLLAIENHLDANYVLSNSITLTSDNWQSLCATAPFIGTLDGRGYTISGLKISGAGYAGLFALNAGTIQNLIVEGDVSGSIDVGILAGNNSGNIQNCLVSGSVTNTGSGNAGGLVGSSKGNISYCGSTATVTGGSGNVGGLVGYMNCHTGGPGADNPSVVNCYAQGDVIGTSRTGGLIGYSNYQNNYKTWTYYGKVVIRNCYASGKVNDGMGGGLLGANNGGCVYNCYYRSSNSGYKAGFSTSTVNLKNQSTFYFWDFDHVWTINGNYPVINLRGTESSITFPGDGVEDDPYLIETERQLYALSADLTTNQPETHFVLTRDIAITSQYWIPIGEYNTFAGTFDGGGHTISNLSISGTDYANVALFAASSGTIRDLNVTGTVSGATAALLVASNSGKIEHCTAIGSVIGSGATGGLCGYNTGSIQNCLASGSVANASNADTGGLVGSSRGAIVACGSTASVIGGSGNVGGLVGYVNCHTGGPGADNPSVVNCYAQGDVIGTSRTGGLIGYSNYQNNYQTWTYYGKVVIRNCYASGKVNDGAGGGLLGANNGGRVYNCYYRSANKGHQAGFAVSTTELKTQSTFYFWDFDHVWTINGTYPVINLRGVESSITFSGDGVEDDPYLIETERQLYALSADLTVNQSETHFVLTRDIAITSQYWIPIGEYNTFAGTFDGGGHTIRNLSISGTDYANVALFAASSGTIRDLNVTGTVSGATAALLVASNSGKIEHCTASGSVTGSSTTGGLAAYNTGTIQDCSVSGSVSNTSNADTGGLVGSSRGAVVICGSTASVVGKGGNVGGLVGYMNCHTGGPGADNPSVINCYAQGDVTGESRTGGLIGYSNYQNNYSVWSYYGNVVIQNCYSIGIVSSSSNNRGGLIGSNNGGTVTSCYYNSSTSGQSDTGKGEPLTTAQMQVQSAYESWDFSEIWSIDANLNRGYPYLKNVPPTQTTLGEITFSQESYTVTSADEISITAVVPDAGSVWMNSFEWEVNPASLASRSGDTAVTWSGSTATVTAKFKGLDTGTARVSLKVPDGRTARCELNVVADSDENKIRPKTLSYNCWDRNDGDFEITVQWGWDTFKNSATVYDNEKAIVGLALSRAAEVGDQTVRAMLQELGFQSPMKSNFYNVALRLEMHKPAYTIGHQRVYLNGVSTNIFALVIRGSTDIEDWLTDFTTEFSESGFHTAADNIMAEIRPYIAQIRSDYPAIQTVFFITGHSLGGATANIIATKLSSYAPDGQVFAYTSASPRTSKIADSSGGHIFNTVNCEDLVPQVPTTWSYRYGVDLPSPGFSRDDPQNAALSLNYSAITGGKNLSNLMSPTLKNRDYKSTITDFARVVSIAHSTDVYLAYLLSRPEASATQHYKIRKTNVLFGNGFATRLFAVADESQPPVDVDVYSASGVLLGRVKSGVVDNSALGGALMELDERGVYVNMIYEGDYEIRISGRGDGTVTYSTEILDSSTNEVIEKKEFSDVQIADGKQIGGTVGDSVSMNDVQLFVVNEAGTTISEIDTKGNEALLHDYAISGIDIKSNSVSVHIAHKAQDKNITLMGALYDADGRFLDIKILRTRIADSIEVPLDAAGVATISVFLMDDSMKSLCPKLNKKLN